DDGFPEGIVVTEAFRREVAEQGVRGVAFHDPRLWRPRHFPAETVYLFSVPGKLDSAWNRPVEGDRGLLREAVRAGQAWRTILFAKRLLQTHSTDEEAEEALEGLGPHQLTAKLLSSDNHARPQERIVPNAFLTPLDSATRLGVISACQLMERRRGQRLCQAGEPGDSMFIVLEGSVGVFRTESDAEPRYTATAGEILGELAFTLRRPRTAALLALDDASLLSIEPAALKAQAAANPVLAASVDRFLAARILEYTCNTRPYLVGPRRDGPLAELMKNRSWDRLLPHSEMIVCEAREAEPVSLADPRFSGSGLYILVSGRLRSVTHADKVLDEADLPLVFVDLPGRIACPDHRYRPEGGSATLLRIAPDAFLGRRPTIDAVAAEAARHIGHLYYYDVFLSYTFDDHEAASRWREALEAAGFRVYMEVARSGHYFRDRIADGILDSKLLVALVSANTMSRPLAQNWVRHEVAFRQTAFEMTTAKIVPIRLRGGKPELLADGYTIIESVGRESQAIDETVSAVRDTCEGRATLPYAYNRKMGLRIET
ncbi:MAG TPA: cyclic nucleotide-binding domain-containing protein, partial [Pirellulaceae bacterium]|nr:cyclic nucleotide-binding domain-containing protein [Pirellulaceae bacterium]